jgi:hypothetical protein
MKERIAFLVVFCALIVSGIVISVSFRANIPEFSLTDKNIEDRRVTIVATGTDDMPSAQELIETSDLIVQVSLTGKRELHKETILTEVVVDSVMQANKEILPGSTLYVYELVRTYAMEESYILIDSIANMMQIGRHYLLCLRFFNKPEGYAYRPQELNMYVLTNPHWSVFPSQSVIRTLTYDLNVPDASMFPTYKECKPFDYINWNERKYANYLALRTALFDLLNYQPISASEIELG